MPDRPLAAPLPIARGASGPPVHDLQDRLGRLGHVVADPRGRFGVATEQALERFQSARGLRVDGRCGDQTWAALVEAGYRLGDRLLYERRPMLRGDDVVELQSRLGRLGFHAGRIDGIFGPETTSALLDFQRNAALTTDGICGPDSLVALDRLGSRTDATTKAGVRETEALLRAPRRLGGRTVFVGEHGGLAVLVSALDRALRHGGAVVVVSHHPAGPAHATAANHAGAELYVGLTTRPEPGCVAAYYRTDTFESAGGHRLAGRLADAVRPIIGAGPCEARGMRLPVLRETRMPAVVCEIGPPSLLVTDAEPTAAAIRLAITRWCEAPLDD